MKSISDYINEAIINEVSHGLAQRAYNKASGAQKNRIKKLYKELYGKDVSKGDTSHITFNVPKDKNFYDENESRMAKRFEYLSQNVLDKIKEVTVTSNVSGEYNENCVIDIEIDGHSYYAETNWSEDNSGKDKYGDMGCELTDTNIKSMKKDFDGNGEDLLDTVIYYIGQDLEK